MLNKVLFPAAVGLLMLFVVVGMFVGLGHGVRAADDPTVTPTSIVFPDPVQGALDLDAVSTIDLAAYPEVPAISAHAMQVYAQGMAQGSNPRTFIKVGDCMTDNPYFLIPLGEGDYDLGAYVALQPVIDYFIDGELNSFARQSQAAAGGFNASSIRDSLWANPEFCESGETPLGCEIRALQPSIALIMFGTNDVFYLNEELFDFFLRSIVVDTMRNGALPVLSTFPHRPEFPEKAVLYNQIVVQIALDYDLPLINLWRALKELPNQGVDPDETTHMTTPPNGAVCYFIDENMQAGFTVRNLLTLQTLEAVLQATSTR